MESEMARAPETLGGETNKEERQRRLGEERQRRLEEARESISQTVTELKESKQVRDPAVETPDWREQVRAHQLLYSLSAFAAGALAAYALSRASSPSEAAREDYGEGGPARSGRDLPTAHVGAARPTPTARVPGRESSKPEAAKGRTVSRLEDELAEMKERLAGELSDVGRNVLLPLFVNKLKERFGIDLSTRREGAGGAGEAERLRAGGRETVESDEERLLTGERSLPRRERPRASVRGAGEVGGEERWRDVPVVPEVPVLLSEADLPAYHEGMLILRLRPQAENFMTVMSEGFEAPGAFSASPGLSVLSLFEEAGKIKRVVPLSRRHAQASAEPRGAMEALSASLSMISADDPNAGVSIVELEHDSDTDALQKLLEKDPYVESVSQVPARYLLASPSPLGDMEPMAVPPADLVMWNLHRIQWEEARRLPDFKEATSINVAVFDTGVDSTHPDLAGRVQNYFFDHPKLPDLSSDRDIVGHGTHVCGTIGALLDNAFGVKGICACRLHVWKIFNDRPQYIRSRNMFAYVVDPVMYRTALADCVDMDIDVVNLSIGGPGQADDTEKSLFRLLIEKGTSVVAAMGNSRQVGSPTSYPAALPNIIAVGATSVDDTVASFSNAGDHITLSAPGVAIWSTMPTYPGHAGLFAATCADGQAVQGKPIPRETNYFANQGTSMAAPHVAAAVALLRAKYGKMSPSDVRDRLVKSADRVPGMDGKTFHRDFGAGRLNLLRLLQ